MRVTAWPSTPARPVTSPIQAYYAGLRKELLKQSAHTDIGLRLRLSTTCLGLVHRDRPHPWAYLPVAVNVSCHKVTRRATAELKEREESPCNIS